MKSKDFWKCWKNRFLFLMFLPLLSFGQENPLSIFKPLEPYIWQAEGQWGDGSTFKQEIHFEFALNDNLVTVTSLGFTNAEQTEYGPRNHGVRQFDPASNSIRFWEFDVFGGITEGQVEGIDKNIVYTYSYQGTALTEMWIHKEETTYEFIVGVYDEGEWKQKFLVTEFRGVKR